MNILSDNCRVLLGLFAYLISPIKYHKGIRVSKLLEKGFQSIGLVYNTTIDPILDTTLCILPSKTGVEKDEQEN